jgi:hypothetical protein
MELSEAARWRLPRANRVDYTPVAVSREGSRWGLARFEKESDA